MRQAVNKRKETLARKKQKQTDDKTTTPTPTPESMPPEDRPRIPSTPALPPPNSSTLHEGGATIPMSSQQQPPPHGLGGVLHLVGGHEAHPPVGPGSMLPGPHSLPPQQQASHGPPIYDHDYRPPPRSLNNYPDSAPSTERNPFLDNGYADLHARLPFSHLDGRDRRGSHEHDRGHGYGWGPGPQG